MTETLVKLIVQGLYKLVVGVVAYYAASYFLKFVDSWQQIAALYVAWVFFWHSGLIVTE